MPFDPRLLENSHGKISEIRALMSVSQSRSCYHFKNFQQTSKSAKFETIKINLLTSIWCSWSLQLWPVGNCFVPIQKYLYAVRETYDRLTVNKKRITRTARVHKFTMRYPTFIEERNNDRVRNLIRVLVETKKGNNWILNDHHQLWVVTFFFLLLFEICN